MKSLAPISVSTYSRLEHLKKTIQALQKNTLAKDSVLYVFSDAPKDGDELIVAKVRDYIRTIDGFKEVRVVEQTVNNMKKNIEDAREIPLNAFGKIIKMEDDIVTAPGFLQYMNDALDYYASDKRILSIAGYCPPFKLPENYKKDSFILQRFNAWGIATWREKYAPDNFNLKEHGVECFLNDKASIKEFCKNGNDLYELLMLEFSGEINAMDVRMMYYQYKFNMFTVYPRKSLVQNIGFDGSGVHCSANNKFYHKELWNKSSNFQFEKEPQVNDGIRKANYEFRRLGLKGYISKFFRKIGIYGRIKVIKNKMSLIQRAFNLKEMLK